MPELKTECVIAVPLDRAWKIAKNSDEFMPTLLPEFVAKAERLEGDGGAGTVRLITLGPGVPGPPGHQVKERVEVFDEASHTLVYSTLEGGDPRFTKSKFTLIFATVDSKSTCVTWIADFTPVDDSVRPPEELKSFAQAAMKAIETYATEHPEFGA